MSCTVTNESRNGGMFPCNHKLYISLTLITVSLAPTSVLLLFLLDLNLQRNMRRWLDLTALMPR